MAENQFKCSGDCLNCRLNPVERKTQWQYCAAQFTYNTMRMVERMQSSLEAMSGKINELEAKVEAIQNSEANVLFPTEDEGVMLVGSAVGDQPIAQEGDGATQ